MTAFGSWCPDDLEARVDRLESLAAIEQLARRYAYSLDGRDIDALVELFPATVRVGANQSGRAALRAWFMEAMSKVGATVHVVTNHIVEFDSASRAHGVVYCRDEVGDLATGEWMVGMLQYHDDYVREQEIWRFERRRFHRWYQVDALTRPAPGAGIDPATDPISTRVLPEALPTWGTFWNEVRSRPGE